MRMQICEILILSMKLQEVLQKEAQILGMYLSSDVVAGSLHTLKMFEHFKW